MGRNPALKILDFFTEALRAQGTTAEALGLPSLSVTEALKTAPSLGPHSLSQLGEEDVTRWVEYWKRVDFL